MGNEDVFKGRIKRMDVGDLMPTTVNPRPLNIQQVKDNAYIQY